MVNYVSITCGFCGCAASIDDFCRTPVSGELPRNVYQCPACGRAFARRSGSPKVYPSGLIVPGPVSLEEVDAVL